jgi:hypothetical protein
VDRGTIVRAGESGCHRDDGHALLLATRALEKTTSFWLGGLDT